MFCLLTIWSSRILIFSLLDGKFSSMRRQRKKEKVFSSEKSIDNVTIDEGKVHALSWSFLLRKLRTVPLESSDVNLPSSALGVNKQFSCHWHLIHKKFSTGSSWRWLLHIIKFIYRWDRSRDVTDANFAVFPGNEEILKNGEKAGKWFLLKQICLKLRKFFIPKICILFKFLKAQVEKAILRIKKRKEIHAFFVVAGEAKKKLKIKVFVSFFSWRKKYIKLKFFLFLFFLLERKKNLKLNFLLFLFFVTVFV